MMIDELQVESDRRFDADEWQCVLQHARHILDNLPAEWGPSSWHKSAEVIQKAFLLLLRGGLAKCRMEGIVTPSNATAITVHLEIWDGFNPDAVQAVFRESAGVDESAEVVQLIRQWSLTTLGLAKRGSADLDELLHTRREPMQWRVRKLAASRPVPADDTQQKTREGYGITETAKMLGLRNKGMVNPLVERGKLRDNGLTGTDRKITSESILAYAKAEGITINDT